MTESNKRLLEIVLMPIVVVVLGTLSSLVFMHVQISSSENQAKASILSAEKIATASIQVQALSIFHDYIISDDESKRKMAISMLSIVDKDLGYRVSGQIAKDISESKAVRNYAREIADSIKVNKMKIRSLDGEIIEPLSISSSGESTGYKLVPPDLLALGYSFVGYIVVGDEASLLKVYDKDDLTYAASFSRIYDDVPLYSSLYRYAEKTLALDFIETNCSEEKNSQIEIAYLYALFDIRINTLSNLSVLNDVIDLLQNRVDGNIKSRLNESAKCHMLHKKRAMKKQKLLIPH